MDNKGNKLISTVIKALDHTSEGILIITLEGRILYYNKAWLDIHAFGPEDDFRGRMLQDVEREEILPLINEARETILKTGSFATQFPTTRRDGKFHVISVGCTLIHEVDPHLVVIILQEVTELVKTQETLKRRNRELGVINEVHAAMTSSLPRGAVIRKMLKVLGDYIGATYYAIYRVDMKERRGNLLTSIGIPQRFRRQISSIDLENPAMVHMSGSGGICVLEQDLPTYRGRLDNLRDVLGVKRTVILVSRARSSHAFITMFGLTRDEEIPADVRHFYQTAAYDFGIAVERVELLDELDRRQRELERRNAELAVIGDILSIISTAPTRKALVRRMLETLKDFTGAASAGLFEIDRSRDHVTIVDGVGVSPRIRRRFARIPISNPSFAWMVHQPGVIVLEEDIPKEIGDRPEIRKEMGLKRTIACTLELGTGRDYQLVLGLDKDEDVKPEIRRFLESAAQRFGLGIERRELLDSLRKSQHELKDLTMRLIDSGEEEKRYLARILHDDIGQIITGLRYEINGLVKTLPPPSSCTRKSLEAIRVQLQLITDSTRKLSRSLHPAMLEELGLVSTLKWYIDNFVRSSALDVDLQEVGFDKRLPSPVEITLYRVAQECLTNVVRHAKASRITIKLTKGYPCAIMSIEDNGRGISNKKSKTPAYGLGLVSMRERVQHIGGTLEIKSARGKWTRIRVEIPIKGSRGGTD